MASLLGGVQAQVAQFGRVDVGGHFGSRPALGGQCLLLGVVAQHTGLTSRVL